MNDSHAEDEVPSGFGLITSDGAYIHAREEYVRLLFYREMSMPKRWPNGSYIFDDPTREILQEVRLPYRAIKILGEGLTATVLLHEKQQRFANPDMEEIPKDDEAGVLVTNALMDLIVRVGKILRSVDETGHDKVISMIKEFLANSKPQFDEIITQHARAVQAK
jgi:hypothetical protein